MWEAILGFTGFQSYAALSAIRTLRLISFVTLKEVFPLICSAAVQSAKLALITKNVLN